MTAVADVKLYELANARDILDEFLAETDGELTPELEQLLDQLQGETKEKIERVALYIREQLALADGIESEAKRLAARVAARRRAAEGLKEYLKRQMERLELKKVEGLLATVALQNNPPSVKSTLTEEALSLAHFEGGALAPFVVEVPASYRLDSKKVIEAHKSGATVPAGISIEQGCHVRIR